VTYYRASFAIIRARIR